MDPTDLFSSKAEKYAKYRWRYAPQCIQTIFDITGITSESWVADIGAGTGILTKEIAGKVQQVFAVEPNPEMRAILVKELAPFASCQVLETRAEATGLEDHSLDLVTIGQAVHFFEPQAARKEFYRVLKPGGWLAICRNYGNDQALGEALQEVYPPETDTEASRIGLQKPKEFYFGRDEYLKQGTPFEFQSTWEAFLGALITSSSAPDEYSPYYPAFEHGAREVFEEFSSNKLIEIHGITELYLGQITGF